MLYSSDIRRAQETAEIISQKLALPIQPCTGLREWHVGTWQHKSADEFEAHLAAVGEHVVTYIPEGGESQLQTQERMVVQMQALAAQHSGETVVCVSHGKAIDLFTRHVLGLDVMGAPPYSIMNTSVSIFRHQPGGWELITLNDVQHLEALET
jgi:broad specificity phosphatase PhoE